MTAREGEERSAVPKHEFGFTCGEFSIALSANRIVLPGSRNQPLRKSLLALSGMNDTAGPYMLRVSSQGRIVCDMPVLVVWVAHESQPQPFLGIQVDNSEELRSALAAYVGTLVQLHFVPREQTITEKEAQDEQGKGSDGLAASRWHVGEQAE